jgi:carboxylate-amine ligase
VAVVTGGERDLVAAARALDPAVVDAVVRGPLQLGVEEEFHLVDPATGQVRPDSARVLDLLPQGRRFKPELMASAVETNSAVVPTLAALRADVVGSRQAVVTAARELGLGLIACGTAPLLGSEPVPVVHSERFAAMQEDYRELADQQFICGCQFHVDCRDRDLAVLVMARLQPWLPLLLALSASSPFWKGHDTGYASFRTLLWRRWPTAGPAPQVASAQEYDALVDDLVASGVAHDTGMIYFDTRPAQRYPTIEIRIADSVPRVDDVVLLAGLCRALVRRSAADVLADPQWRPPPVELLEAARWRAARSGLDGALLHPRTFRPVPAAEAIADLLEHVTEAAAVDGDTDELRELAARALADGGSAARQREAAESGGIPAAVRSLQAETALTERPEATGATVRPGALA